jgi:putative phosphoesterase
MLTLGVISDTHIPDRARSINPAALSVFQRAKVEAILHAGDISTPRVLKQLGEIAPVHAVRGNRDWLALRSLPKELELKFEGVTLGLAHGQGRVWNYVTDRISYYLHGMRPEVFQRRMLAAFPEADVLVYGHIHRPVNCRVDGKLLFNPGSVHFPEEVEAASVGLLRIYGKGQVDGEIVFLSSG